MNKPQLWNAINNPLFEWVLLSYYGGTLFSKIIHCQELCYLKLNQYEWNIPLLSLVWEMEVTLTQRSSLNFQPWCRASEQWFTDTTFYISFNFVISKDIKPWAHFPVQTWWWPFIHSSALFWAHQKPAVFKFWLNFTLLQSPRIIKSFPLFSCEWTPCCNESNKPDFVRLLVRLGHCFDFVQKSSEKMKKKYIYVDSCSL